jgi:hypothetical protein
MAMPMAAMIGPVMIVRGQRASWIISISESGPGTVHPNLTMPVNFFTQPLFSSPNYFHPN